MRMLQSVSVFVNRFCSPYWVYECPLSVKTLSWARLRADCPLRTVCATAVVFCWLVENGAVVVRNYFSSSESSSYASVGVRESTGAADTFLSLAFIAARYFFVLHRCSFFCKCPIICIAQSLLSLSTLLTSIILKIFIRVKEILHEYSNHRLELIKNSMRCAHSYGKLFWGWDQNFEILHIEKFWV